MIRFKHRLLFNTAALVAVSGLCIAFYLLLDAALRPASIYTGLLLLVLVLFLTLFNARKKLPFLPLTKASTWLQFHIYAGYLSMVVFLLHIGFRIPNGNLEIILTAVFCIVALSGIVGLVISRLLPREMARSGTPVDISSIPAYRAALCDDVEKLVLSADAELDSSAIGDFYLNVLAPYFYGNPGLQILLGDPNRFEARVLARLDGFDRYLNEREKDIVNGLKPFVRRKRNLDFQLACRKLLRLWLFVHIPLSYGLIILALVHAYLVLAFGGRF